MAGFCLVLFYGYKHEHKLDKDCTGLSIVDCFLHPLLTGPSSHLFLHRDNKSYSSCLISHLKNSRFQKMSRSKTEQLYMEIVLRNAPLFWFWWVFLVLFFLLFSFLNGIRIDGKRFRHAYGSNACDT